MPGALTKRETVENDIVTYAISLTNSIMLNSIMQLETQCSMIYFLHLNLRRELDSVGRCRDATDKMNDLSFTIRSST